MIFFFANLILYFVYFSLTMLSFDREFDGICSHVGYRVTQLLFWGITRKVSLGIVVEKFGIHIWKAHEK